MTLKVNDIVMIRGDKRRNMNGSCAYTSDQLINGKYLKHTGTGKAWEGKIQRVCDDMALVGGGWWGIDMLEIKQEV